MNSNKSIENSKVNLTFNISTAVFAIVYVVVWAFVSILMFRFRPINISIYMGVLLILLNLGIFICFLLFIFYNPWNHSLQKKINKSKQKYKKLQQKTEKTYQQHIKVFWLNDLNQQTQYYLYAYMILSFLPFFYFLVSILVQKFIPVDTDKLHVFIVQFSLFYTGLQLLIYTIAIKKWLFIIIPAILFLFILAIGYLNLLINLSKTVLIVTLLVLISIATLKVSSYWVIVPFLLCGVIFVLLGLTAYQ